ncbi:hypothetical protein [Candidatus Brachybacter algidus]|uniref:hypothetical protein n=1 Tax=Candidatus Brachybacter algidus TaxID=2982024 RepID=UPI00257C8765|nr:hypothetical protein [Candidatus Brachybacter algidus]
MSSYTNFKRYYNELVLVHWRDLFPGLVTYERFNQTQNRLFVPLLMFWKTDVWEHAPELALLTQQP